jgi:hypothetical protein
MLTIGFLIPIWIQKGITSIIHYEMQPDFTTHHTASLVVKKFVAKLKSMFNGSYTFATGRPYYNIRYDNGDAKYKVYDQGTTIAYHS